MEYDIVVDVSDLTPLNIGDYTIEKIENIIKKNWKPGYKVLIDFSNLTLLGSGMDKGSEYLLKVLSMYDCDIINISEEFMNEFICYHGGNYYLIDNIFNGKELNYYRYFKKQLEENSYGLMIKDNFYNKDVIKKSIIKPISMDDNKFTYLELKSGFAEPKDIIGLTDSEIFSKRVVSNSDLLERKLCIRFPIKGTESQILELYDKLLKSK